MTLKDWMEANGLKDADLAESLGLSRSQVTRLRNRAVNPSFETASKLVEMSKGKVSIAELAAEEAERAPSSPEAA